MKELQKVYIIIAYSDGYTNVQAVYLSRKLAEEHLEAVVDDYGTQKLFIEEVEDSVSAMWYE